MLLTLATRMCREIARMRARHRSRSRLMELDERMLKDIGVRREDILREARKPFWRE